MDFEDHTESESGGDCVFSTRGFDTSCDHKLKTEAISEEERVVIGLPPIGPNGRPLSSSDHSTQHGDYRNNRENSKSKKRNNKNDGKNGNVKPFGNDSNRNARFKGTGSTLNNGYSMRRSRRNPTHKGEIKPSRVLKPKDDIDTLYASCNRQTSNINQHIRKEEEEENEEEGRGNEEDGDEHEGAHHTRESTHGKMKNPGHSKASNNHSSYNTKKKPRKPGKPRKTKEEIRLEKEQAREKELRDATIGIELAQRRMESYYSRKNEAIRNAREKRLDQFQMGQIELVGFREEVAPQKQPRHGRPRWLRKKIAVMRMNLHRLEKEARARSNRN